MSDLYTVEEAAEILKIHPKTLRKKIREGEIPAVLVGKRYRLTREQLDRLCGRDAGTGGEAPGELRNVPAAMVSSVVDADGVSREESMRLSNTIMAVLNSGLRHVMVDCLYYQEQKKFKVLVNCGIETAPEILTLIRGLILPGSGTAGTGEKDLTTF